MILRYFTLSQCLSRLASTKMELSPYVWSDVNSLMEHRDVFINFFSFKLVLVFLQGNHGLDWEEIGERPSVLEEESEVRVHAFTPAETL